MSWMLQKSVFVENDEGRYFKECAWKVVESKLKKLQEQRDLFENNLSHAYNVVPDVKHILTVRING